MPSLGAYSRVFCLEGDWEGELTSRSSVRPMLELLEGLKRIEYVHKDVGTRAELRYYLRRWLDEDPSVAEYGTLYLAFHGGARGPRRAGERVLQISEADDGEISLEELASILGANMTGVVIHLGSCSLLRERPRALHDFLEATGAKAVAGYTTDVEWVASAAMDMLFFDKIADYSQWPAAKRALEGDEALRTLRKTLGFKIFPT
jgi:hypothetical protein